MLFKADSGWSYFRPSTEHDGPRDHFSTSGLHDMMIFVNAITCTAVYVLCARNLRIPLAIVVSPSMTYIQIPDRRGYYPFVTEKQGYLESNYDISSPLLKAA
jgi:hypothetical protein